MAGGLPMDLNPVEQSFFDEGDASEAPLPVVNQAPRRHRHRSRRHSRRALTRWLPRKLRDLRWGRSLLSLVLVIGAVSAGYWLSMYVSTRDLPDPSEFGVQSPGR